TAARRMCGIFGSNSGADVEAALSLMPRGDDERHVVKSGHVVFGVRRHAVVALKERPSQPYQTDHQLLCANGELFDHEYIRDHLLHSVRLPDEVTDIRILHHLLLERGVYEVCQFNMMMACAAYDIEQDVVTLFRDWVGE